MKRWINFQIVAFKDEIFSSFVDNDLVAVIVRNLRTFSIMTFHFVIADKKISWLQENTFPSSKYSVFLMQTLLLISLILAPSSACFNCFKSSL